MSSVLDNITVGERPAPSPVVTADFSGAQTGKSSSWGTGVDATASRQWATRPDDERFTTLDALITAVNDRRARSQDKVLPLRSLLALNDGNQLEVGAQGWRTDLRPTSHAFTQLCAAAGVPGSYLRTLNTALAADCLSYSLSKQNPDQNVQLLHAGNTLRGVTGENYGRIWDGELAEAVKAATEAGGGRWEVPTAFRSAQGGEAYPVIDVTKEDTTLYAGDRDCFLFLVDQRNPIECGKLADGSPDLYFRGFYAWNGECGGVSNGVGTFLYRYICCNRLIWGQKGFQKLTIRHTKNAGNRFVQDMVPALQAFVDGSATGIENGLLTAKRTVVARDDEKRHSFLEMYDFGPKEQRLILDRILEEEGHPAESVFDFVQGITAYARSIGNQDSRMQVERVGEKLLTQVMAAAG